MEALPNIKAKKIEKLKNKKNPWDFLHFFTDQYFNLLNDIEIIKYFNDSQHTLMAYHYLYGKIIDIGFKQLIQYTLPVYHNFYDQAESDDYIQLVEAALLAYPNFYYKQVIQNGYGKYVLTDKFSDTVYSWGACELASIMQEAKIIYNKFKDELKAEQMADSTSETDLSDSEEPHLISVSKILNDFEPLDSRLIEIFDSETVKIKNYIERNVGLFVKVI